MTVAAQTQAQFKALILRNLPERYAAGWEGKDGEEIFEAIAAVAAKVSERMAEHFDALYVLRATGPQRATGTVTITWANGTTLAHTLLSGQVIAGTRWGVEYRLTEDVVAAAGQSAGYALTVGVEAVVADFESNVAAIHVDQWGLPTGVNRKANILWGTSTTDSAKDEFLAGLDDGSITVAGATAMTGGRLGTLDMMGAGRGKPRGEGEPDDVLRQRIRSKSLRLTPNAITLACNNALKPYGVTCTLKEPWSYWFVIGDSTKGVIGDSENPISRLRHFIVEVQNLGTTVDGFVIGQPSRGVIGKSSNPIGKGDTVAMGIIAGLQQLVDRIKPAGVWGKVVEAA